MKKIATILSLAALVAAVPASASTVLVGSDGPTQDLYQSWIDAALVPTADTRVVLHMEPCPSDIQINAAWCMSYQRGTVALWSDGDFGYLWADSGAYSERDRLVVKLTLLHEVGHVFDYTTRGPKEYRRAFMRVMGYRLGGSWAAAQDRRGGWVYPNEQWAQAYGFCALYPRYADAAYARTVWPGYDYNPTAKQYGRACNLIRRLSA